MGNLVVGLLAIGLYFLPTIVAMRREKVNMLPIALLNLLAGWTGVGWIGALIWAISTQAIDVAAAGEPEQKRTATLCANCGKYSPSGTRFCPHCGAGLPA